MYLGTIAATIANVNRAKTTKPYSWRDMLPHWSDRKGKTVEEQITIVEHLNVMFGGIDKRGDKASTA